LKDSYKILGLIGDGIGREIVPEAFKVLDAAQEAFDFNLEYIGPYECGAKYWVTHDLKRGWDEEVTRDLFYEADAIVKGPTGLPDLVGRLPGPYLPINMRIELDLYANIRPCRLRPGVESVLSGRKPGDIDYIVLRENTEHMYVGIGGFMKRGNSKELAIDNYVQTKKGCDRIIRFGFDLARSGDYKGRAGAPIDGKRRLTCACKWGLCKGDDLFKEIYDGLTSENTDIEKDSTWIDSWSYYALLKPGFYDVVVMPNQYGDIMSDMSGAIQGSLGLAGSINAGDEHCYAEATHGSAPDIAGRGISNPTSMILSVGMMLNWLGEMNKDDRLKKAWRGIDGAIDIVLSGRKVRTMDLGGSSCTVDYGDAVADAVRHHDKG
jgi:3-isopropylmalate dehydrogenase